MSVIGNAILLGGGGGGILTGTTPPSASLGNDGDIYKRSFPLPANVTFVDFCISSGTQYIDSKIYFTPDIDVYAKLKHLSPDAAAFGVRKGSWSSFSNSLFLNDTQTTAVFFKVTSSMAGTSGTEISLSSNEIYEVRAHTIKTGSTYAYVPEVKGTAVNEKINQASFSAEYKIRLFGYGGSSPAIGAGAAIQRLVLYDAGIPAADYLACIDSNNVVCMWDNIAQEYAYNDGTGVFTYGSVLSTPPTELDPVYYVKQNGAWEIIDA